MTLPEWISKYTRKTGEQFSIPPNFQLAFDEQHGFFVFGFSWWNNKEWIQFAAVCTNSWKWVFDSVIDTVMENKLEGCMAKTNRNPKAYAKLTSGKYYGDDTDGGHIFTWEVQDVQF